MLKPYDQKSSVLVRKLGLSWVQILPCVVRWPLLSQKDALLGRAAWIGCALEQSGGSEKQKEPRWKESTAEHIYRIVKSQLFHILKIFCPRNYTWKKILQGTEALNQLQRKAERYCVSLKKLVESIYANKISKRSKTWLRIQSTTACWAAKV